MGGATITQQVISPRAPISGEREDSCGSGANHPKPLMIICGAPTIRDIHHMVSISLHLTSLSGGIYNISTETAVEFVVPSIPFM